MCWELKVWLTVKQLPQVFQSARATKLLCDDHKTSITCNNKHLFLMCLRSSADQGWAWLTLAHVSVGWLGALFHLSLILLLGLESCLAMLTMTFSWLWQKNKGASRNTQALSRLLWAYAWSSHGDTCISLCWPDQVTAKLRGREYCPTTVGRHCRVSRQRE